MGIAFYHRGRRPRRAGRVPGDGRARSRPKLQVDDLGVVLPEVGFDYAAPAGGPAWNELSPRGRRMGIARAHARVSGKRSPSWPA